MFVKRYMVCAHHKNCLFHISEYLTINAVLFNITILQNEVK